MSNDESPRLAGRLLGLATATTLVFIAACGNVTAGGFTEVTVEVSGDAPDPAAQPAVLESAPALSAASPSGPLPSSHDDAENAEGEIEIDFRPSLVSETGDVIPLGRDDIRVKIDLQGVNRAEALRELVPAGRYTALRLSFTHIQVEVSDGLIIDGQLITGELRVALEDPELVVDRPLDIEAAEGGMVGLLVNLNTPAWLAAVDPVTRTVDATVFAGLIDVVAQ